MPLIGFLSPEEASGSSVDSLRAGLRELGYIDGQNIRIESRWAGKIRPTS
jgi:hypothetical protein